LATDPQFAIPQRAGGLALQKVLIVDDEHNIRNILDFSLNAEGFAVISASNGEEAFDAAVNERPDLVILDVMMPKGDGFATCRLIKQDSRTAHIPVVLLTARTTREDRERGHEVGADGYITKPFSPDRVIETVQSLLGVKRK
jgi:DNA-binding response OmpR family regulator